MEPGERGEFDEQRIHDPGDHESGPVRLDRDAGEEPRRRRLCSLLRRFVRLGFVPLGLLYLVGPVLPRPRLPHGARDSFAADEQSASGAVCHAHDTFDRAVVCAGVLFERGGEDIGLGEILDESFEPSIKRRVVAEPWHVGVGGRTSRGSFSTGTCGRSAGQTGARLRARFWGPISAITVPSPEILSPDHFGDALRAAPVDEPGRANDVPPLRVGGVVPRVRRPGMEHMDQFVLSGCWPTATAGRPVSAGFQPTTHAPRRRAGCGDYCHRGSSFEQWVRFRPEKGTPATGPSSPPRPAV